ncbi:uncharacterized protein LOC105443616 [Strongylocentrotus purpuratus]|uniref:Uncharacterized protein n=1 Tax=Strongylocentrotus purpuratus TaxID=7668 RepID=A0A7M7NCB6_STRPU|nr:uncharacterized protein LOC105443616 [Strongylocentrotus purpuratus]|eukprot:XP_011675276.1 PREDICTED: uncharacterized protein LOC105443616 [Strongylocentrotus purpuratus]
MTSFNSNTKMALMLVFKKSQPTTFQCSKCVIQCNNLAKMQAQDLSRLTEFLGKIPSHPLPIAEVEAPTTQMASSTSDTAQVSQASPKVDTSPDRYATQDKVIDITYPIALVSLSSSNQPEKLRDGLRRQFPGKTIVLIKDIHGLASNRHFFEAILVDLGSLQEAASYSSDEKKLALDIYQKCVKEMLVPQNLAMLMLAPTNTHSEHKHADIIRMISEIAKTRKVSVFQYSSESCRPSHFDVDMKKLLVNWLLDCIKRYHAAAPQEGPGFFGSIQIQKAKFLTFFKKLGR